MTWLGIGICDFGEVVLLEEMHGAVTEEEGDAGSRVLWSRTAMLSMAKRRSILGMRGVAVLILPVCRALVVLFRQQYLVS
jgi:hypothetical protein